jgi:IS5 family transposase
VHADKGYDHRRCRRYLAARGITARIAPPRDRVLQLAWPASLAGGAVVCLGLGCYRRLGVRWHRCWGRFYAFAELACALVCVNILHQLPRGL